MLFKLPGKCACSALFNQDAYGGAKQNYWKSSSIKHLPYLFYQATAKVGEKKGHSINSIEKSISPDFP